MLFNQQYDTWWKRQLSDGSGERRRRLKEGHGYAEKLFLEQVWWPAVGHFEHLHAEYEVYDFKDGTRYLDFAYIRLPIQICIEIDGFGPHNRDINRRQFADGLVRQNHLVIDGWKVIRFAVDDVRERPRHCQQTIQQMMGRWFGGEQFPETLTWKQRDILRFALHKKLPVTPREIGDRLSVSDRYARMLLRQLVDAKMMLPASGKERVRSYRMNPAAPDLHL